MTGPRPLPLLEESVVEQLLGQGAGSGDAALQQAVALIATMSTGPAPQPSAALADVLAHGFVPGPVPLRPSARRPRRWALRAGAGLAAAAASVVVAGTAAALPSPVQDAVADLVGALTPFDLPRSTPGQGAPVEEPARGVEEPARGEDPTPTGEPERPALPTSPAPVAPGQSASTRTDEPPPPGDDETPASGRPAEDVESSPDEGSPETAEHTDDADDADDAGRAEEAAEAAPIEEADSDPDG